MEFYSAVKRKALLTDNRKKWHRSVHAGWSHCCGENSTYGKSNLMSRVVHIRKQLTGEEGKLSERKMKGCSGCWKCFKSCCTWPLHSVYSCPSSSKGTTKSRAFDCIKCTSTNKKERKGRVDTEKGGRCLQQPRRKMMVAWRWSWGSNKTTCVKRTT